MATLSLARSDLDARPRERGLPTVVDHARLSLSGCVFALFAADVTGSAALATAIFLGYAYPLHYGNEQVWLGAGGFVVAWSAAAASQALYTKASLVAGLRSHLIRATVTWTLAFGLLLLAGFALKMMGGVSRMWFLSWAAGALAWVTLVRVAWTHYVRRQRRQGGCLDRVLVLASSSDVARRVGTDLERESGGDIRIAASVGLPGTMGGPSLSWVEDVVRAGCVDRVVIAAFEDAVVHVNPLLARLARVTVDVTLMPNLEGLQAPILSVGRIGILPAIDLDSRPLSPSQAVVKRVEDFVVASAIFLFTLPLFLLVCAAIKLDSRGPVFFGQIRAGYHDRTFRVWKFRTMHHNLRDDGAIRQTARGDARVTRVGRLLRRTSLDELPQIINVLAGQMSIVGPRPHALGMTAVGLPLHSVVQEYSARHRLKPGITGWAQISGCRGEVDTLDKLRRRVALDCFYIENWSLAFDAWIMVRTAALLLSDPDAY